MHLSLRKILLFAGLLFLLISIPLTLSLTQKSQDTRTRASASTSLSLIPQPGTGNYIEKAVGDAVPVDVMIDPGTNAVGYVTLQLKYDPTKLEPIANNPFTVNTAKFPVVFEGPDVTPGLISLSVSIGADQTKAIQGATAKLGTANFKAIGVTGDNATDVEFTNITRVLSAGTQDATYEEVLSGKNPASISIIAAAVSPSVTAAPTFSPDETTLSFTLLLHGIGIAGDSSNPTGSSLSTKIPKTPQRNVTVEVFNNNDELVVTKTGVINYDAQDGNFTGTVSLGTNFPTGPYKVKIKSDQYLRKLVTGIPTITSGQNTQIAVTSLVAGDTNGDNTLDILDYSALLDCGYGNINPLPMSNSSSSYKQQVCQVHTPAKNVDINDNGTINSFDYNLFLRELSVQSGD